MGGAAESDTTATARDTTATVRVGVTAAACCLFLLLGFALVDLSYVSRNACAGIPRTTLTLLDTGDAHGAIPLCAGAIFVPAEYVRSGAIIRVHGSFGGEEAVELQFADHGAEASIAFGGVPIDAHVCVSPLNDGSWTVAATCATSSASQT